MRCAGLRDAWRRWPRAGRPADEAESDAIMNAMQRESIVNRLHLLLALLALWLVLSSPWVSMLRRVPGDAGFFDYAHMILGAHALLVGAL